jgi:hypothetical protein
MSHRATIQLDPTADAGLAVTAKVYTAANAVADTIACPETGTGTARYSGTSGTSLADGTYDVVFFDALGSLRGGGNLFISRGQEVGPNVNVTKVNGRDANPLSNLNGMNMRGISPTDTSGRTVLVAGDDYTQNAIGDNRLTYTVNGFTGSVSGATVTWKIVPRDLYDKSGASAAEVTVTTGTATLVGDALTMKVPLTQAQSAALRHVSHLPTEVEYRSRCRSSAATARR